MTTKEILTKARELISDPDKWLKKEYARTSKDGIRCAPNANDAQCFCSLGAIMHVCGIDSLLEPYCNEYNQAMLALRGQIPSLEGPLVSEFNDSHSHEEVLELFDKAIASL